MIPALAGLSFTRAEISNILILLFPAVCIIPERRDPVLPSDGASWDSSFMMVKLCVVSQLGCK